MGLNICKLQTSNKGKKQKSLCYVNCLFVCLFVCLTAAANGASACYNTLNTNGQGYGTCAPEKQVPCAKE